MRDIKRLRFRISATGRVREPLVRSEELYAGAALDKQSMIHDEAVPSESGMARRTSSEITLERVSMWSEAMLAAFYVLELLWIGSSR